MGKVMSVILAAGEGKRMKSSNSKLIHKICGREVVKWVYSAVSDCLIDEIVMVVGHNADQVKECMNERVNFVTQDKQLGTGHALMQAKEYFDNKEGHILVICGDTPLITCETLTGLINFHKQNDNHATILTAKVKNSTGYGRIIRDDEGKVLKIVEESDATDIEKSIKEVNSGIYCFDIKSLSNSLNNLQNNNNQGEFYLTDTIEILIKNHMNVGAFQIQDENEILGINDRVQLYEATTILKSRIIKKHMLSGVTIMDPNSTFIDYDVEIDNDTIIYPSTVIEGSTVIGKGCVMGPNSLIRSSTIRNNVIILNSTILESSIDDRTNVGPYAYIRPGSNVGKDVKIGDFVEIKKSLIGDKTKISHLSYIGDSEVGKSVNIGCGVVVVNYDGKKKNKTIVGDNAFIGCNVNLVSPVTVGENAYIAAGSTITEQVPGNSLAIARTRQTVKEDWVIKKDLKNKD